MRKALTRLADDYQEMTFLRYDHDLAVDEIGRRRDCSSEAARKLWSQAMERLQEESEKIP